MFLWVQIIVRYESGGPDPHVSYNNKKIELNKKYIFFNINLKG